MWASQPTTSGRWVSECGTDGGQQDRLHAGHQDRAARGQRVGSGAGRSGHDHAIGLVLHDMLAVDAQFETDQARHRALDHRIVESIILRDLLAVAQQATIEQRARLGGTLAFHGSGQRGIEFIEAHLREKAERAEVDGEQRNFGCANGARRRQQRAVAAEDKDELGLVACNLGARNHKLIGLVGSGLLVNVDAVAMRRRASATPRARFQSAPALAGLETMAAIFTVYLYSTCGA